MSMHSLKKRVGSIGVIMNMEKCLWCITSADVEPIDTIFFFGSIFQRNKNSEFFILNKLQNTTKIY